MSVTISALWVHPVKGMAGIALREAKLLPTGIEGDREWLVVDEQLQGLTLRECPRLVTITPHLSGRALGLTSAAGEIRGVEVDGEALTVTVFGKPARALAVNRTVDQWLSDQLGQPVRLVRFDHDFPRWCKPERFGSTSMLFADGAPYLVANISSLAALDRNRDQRRFRANIWLDGLPPFAEHRSNTLTAASAQFRLVDHCKRCAVVLVDPVRGERTESGDWLLEIAALNAMPDRPEVSAFGINATLISGTGGIIRVGESVTLGAE